MKAGLITVKNVVMNIQTFRSLHAMFVLKAAIMNQWNRGFFDF